MGSFAIEKALAGITPATAKPRRYRPTDQQLAVFDAPLQGA
jgi:hypothetical protein